MLLLAIMMGLAMPEDHDIEGAVTQFLEKLRPLARQLIELGERRQVQRIMAALAQTGSPPSDATVVATPVQRLDIATAPVRQRTGQRAAPGSVKDAVRDAISANPNGISQQDIDSFVLEEQGITLKPSSRRMAIIKLHSEGVITERGNLWFPAHPAQEAGAQTPVPENG